MDLDRVLRMLGSHRFPVVRAYRRLMREEVADPYEDARSWSQSVKGDETFADRVLQAAGQPPVVVPRDLTIERVVRAVAAQQRVGLAAMRGPGQAQLVSFGRLAAAWVGREVARMPLAQTALLRARHFDDGQQHGISGEEDGVGSVAENITQPDCGAAPVPMSSSETDPGRS